MHGDTVIVEIVARGARGAEGQIVEIVKRGIDARRRHPPPPRQERLARARRPAHPRPDRPHARDRHARPRRQQRQGRRGRRRRRSRASPSSPTRTPRASSSRCSARRASSRSRSTRSSSSSRSRRSTPRRRSPRPRRTAPRCPTDMLEGREDLTHIPLPTIDPEDARDHDDAVWVERTDERRLRGVGRDRRRELVRAARHGLDDEAKRPRLQHLPARPRDPDAPARALVEPLLAPADVIRLCLCVEAELDAKGDVKKTRLVRGFMKSAAKLTYGGVARALGFTDRAAARARRPRRWSTASASRTSCSRILRARAHEARRARLRSARAGREARRRRASRSSVTKRAKDPGVKKAYQLIEELMLLANEVVARWLVEHELPGVFRVHPPPDEEARAPRGDVRGARHRARRRGRRRRRRASPSPRRRFADHPNASVLNILLLRSMKQATYDVANLGHFGLASEAYLHFTSPIRRYPGPRRPPHRARGARRATSRRARSARARGDAEKLAGGGARSRRSPSAARWRSSARSSTSTAAST